MRPAATMQVLFPPRPGSQHPHKVVYQGQDTWQLQPAWAMTVHKSQGGEYPVVVLPLHHLVGRPLQSRQLLYTAVTRARQLLLVVATRQAVHNCLGTDILAGGGGGGGRSAAAAASCTAQRVAEALVAVGVAAEVAVRGSSGRPAAMAAPVSLTRGASVTSGAARPQYPAAWSRGGPGGKAYPTPSRKTAEAPPSTDPAPAIATAPPGQAAAPAGGLEQKTIAPPAVGLGLRRGVQPILRRRLTGLQRLMATRGAADAGTGAAHLAPSRRLTANQNGLGKPSTKPASPAGS